MDRFEYKVLWSKMRGMLQQDWFDGDQNLGNEIAADVLNRFGVEGWEVCGTMQMEAGQTHKIILKRQLTA